MGDCGVCLCWHLLARLRSLSVVEQLRVDQRQITKLISLFTICVHSSYIRCIRDLGYPCVAFLTVVAGAEREMRHSCTFVFTYRDAPNEVTHSTSTGTLTHVTALVSSLVPFHARANTIQTTGRP